MAFGDDQLEDMVAVGAVTGSSVRLWMRTAQAGRHEIRLRRESQSDWSAVLPTVVAADPELDHTHAVEIPGDFEGAQPLAAATPYRFQVVRVSNGAQVGNGRFETAPADADSTPARFSIALASCHMPFDSTGELSAPSLRLLRILVRILRQHGVKLVLLAGDQIYSDVPEKCSLFDEHYFSKLTGKRTILNCHAAEVRRIYQERYRIFLAVPELAELYAQFPCYPILDDHEIRDDWGTLTEHAGFRSLRAGAREAYFDYQGSRVAPRRSRLPGSFHYDFAWGDLGVFVADLRSQREAGDPDNTILGDAQHAAFEAFLASSADKRALILVTSVPLVHVPEWMADAGHWIVGRRVDFGDHWSLKANLRERDRLLVAIHGHMQRHPKQRFVIVGGDVHLGAALEIRWDESDGVLHQLTSSAISNRLGSFEKLVSPGAPRATTRLEVRSGSKRLGARVSLLPPASNRYRSNPFTGLNVGILDFIRKDDHSDLRFRIAGYDHDDGRAPTPKIHWSSQLL